MGLMVCRFANQGLNTFLFAMMSLELKHRAPKVIYTTDFPNLNGCLLSKQTLAILSF